MAIQDKRIWDFIEKIRDANSLAHLQDLSRRYTSQIGFDSVGFAMHVAAPAAKPEYHYFQNFQEPWGSNRYRLYGSATAAHDPIVAHILAGLPPTSFNCNGVVTHSRDEFVKRSSKLMERAQDFGIRSGVLVPLDSSSRTWSFMLATTPANYSVDDALAKMPNFHLFAHYIHSAARLMLDVRTDSAKLTARECEVLRWAAIGKTSWEMSHILCVAESTVNFHISAAVAKLQVRGRRAACAKALMLGLIDL